MEPYDFVGDLGDSRCCAGERVTPNVRQITSTHFLSLSRPPVKHQNDGLQHHMLRWRIIFFSALDLSARHTPAVLLHPCNTCHITSEAKLHGITALAMDSDLPFLNCFESLRLGESTLRFAWERAQPG